MRLGSTHQPRLENVKQCADSTNKRTDIVCGVDPPQGCFHMLTHRLTQGFSSPEVYLTP